MTYLRTKLSWRILAGAALGLLAIPMLGGCPGSLDLQPFTHASSSSAGGSASVSSASTGATGSGGSTCDAVAQIITPTCAIAGCHSGGQAVAQANLDLTESSLPGLVGRPASECGGLIIDPTTPSNSVLYIKVTAGVTCAARMPFGGPYLSDADQQCLLTWIESEASMGTSSSTAAANSTAAASSTAAGSSTAASSSSSAGTGGASSAGGSGGASSAGGAGGA